MKSFHFFVLSAALSVSANVLANEPTYLDQWKKTIEKASQGRATIVKTTQAPDGLTALVIDASKGEVSQGEVLAWGLPNGLLMIGNLYDRDGNLVNARFNLAQHDLNESLMTILEKASKEKHPLTSEGQGREFFVFIDPGCGHCKKTWASLHGRVPEGVKITWLPVNILSSPEADLKMAYASRGLDEMNEVMSQSTIDGLKSFDPMKNTDAQNAAAGLGMAVMGLSKRKATPMIIWRDANGNQKIEYTTLSPEWLSSRK